MKRKDNVTMTCVRNFASSVIPRWSHRLILQWSHFCGYLQLYILQNVTTVTMVCCHIFAKKQYVYVAFTILNLLVIS